MALSSTSVLTVEIIHRVSNISIGSGREELENLVTINHVQTWKEMSTIFELTKDSKA